MNILIQLWPLPAVLLFALVIYTGVYFYVCRNAKYGAPTEAKPKVFFKYFYVNTATGEKSGEMQLAGELATD